MVNIALIIHRESKNMVSHTVSLSIFTLRCTKFLNDTWSRFNSHISVDD